MSTLPESPVRRALIVLNPTAGGGLAATRRPEVERLISETVTKLERGDAPCPIEWRIVETTAPGDAIRLAADAAKDGYDLVAAAGGDGTCSEVANGIAGTRTRLGILPIGRGNDFARCIGLKSKELPFAVDTLFTGTPRPMDAGRTQNQLFINISGCGFDAVSTVRANRGFRLFKGQSAYLAAVFTTLVSYHAPKMRLTIDGKTHELKAMMCSVCNMPSYGGGMMVAPDAKLDDGLFDICLLKDAGKVEFVMAFPRVFAGTHTTHPKVTMLRGKRVAVETDPILPVLIDGDVVGTTPVEFEIVPNALTLMAPALPSSVWTVL